MSCALVLKQQLGARAIVIDPDAGAAPNALRTARQAWRKAAKDDEWAAVFQDDAIPLSGLNATRVEQLWQEAQQMAGQPIAVAFYYGAQSRTGARMRRVDTRWATCGFAGRPRGEYLATVAVAVPREWALGWYLFSMGPAWIDSTRDDECWGAYLDFMDYEAVATVPCFVDHDNNLPSIAGNHAHGPRIAAVTPPRTETKWSS
jgi:hypothetical protein